MEAALRRIAVPLFACTAIRVVSREAFDLMADAQSHLPILEAIRSKDPETARKSCLVALEEWRSRLLPLVIDDAATD